METTNQDLTFRRTELLNLNEKHREDFEKMNVELNRLRRNQSYVLDSLWGKVGKHFSIFKTVCLLTFQVAGMELEMKTDKKLGGASEEIIKHDQTDLDSLGDKVINLEKIIGERVENEEANLKGTNVVVQ